MNGLSLLLMLSSLGATTGVEVGANGQPVYAIRIESVLVNELRNGQAIPILVAARDRQIRQFSISVIGDGRNNRYARASDLSSRSGDLFDYEAAQLENGEIEYVVQISPERLESLAAGKPIQGTIGAEVPEVNRFLIFVGIGQLPSQQAAAKGTGRPAPSLLTGGSNGLIPAGAEVWAGGEATRTAVPSSRPTFPTSAPATSQPATGSVDPLTQFQNRSTDPRTAWRNQPDQSTVSPPPFINSNSTAPNSGSVARSTGVPPATIDRNAYTNAPFSPPYNSSYPQQPYPEPNQGYAPTNTAPYNQQNYGATSQPNYAATNPALNYQQPVAVTAARTDLPPANPPTAPPVAPPANWSNQAAAPAYSPATNAPVAVTKPEPAPERPWTPLIMTTLALFASLGANAYLGWLAWSFFWRFRDAATESARARSQHSLIRQAA